MPASLSNSWRRHDAQAGRNTRGLGVTTSFLASMKTALWHNVLANAVWALKEAEASLQTPDRHAHYTTKAGWWRTAPKQGRKIPSETAVTEALVDEIERLRRLAASQGASAVSDLGFGNFEHLAFAVEQPRRVKVGLGDKSKPTDIRVYLTGSPAIDLRIEAKTLVSNAEIQTEYLSDRGMMRFCDPHEPYTIEPFGGMVAYTVSATPTEWSDQIKAGLTSTLGAAKVGHRRFHSDQVETLVCELERPAYVDPDGVVGVVSAGPLHVFHLALQVRTEPAEA